VGVSDARSTLRATAFSNDRLRVNPPPWIAAAYRFPSRSSLRRIWRHLRIALRCCL